ncbi:MAG TPA: Mor transcription activator family protein [Candidatus Rifleibacterium sp.]|jgi:Mor family transcriptional regulator|nr:Mor transcription activator family protein [Candidatus Rifleibacterium sp.]HPW57653.1 Mor transcription activator family protein [Candidatus Rifleibacterium sp.]
MGKPVVELPEICLVIAENIGAQLEADGISTERAAAMALNAAKTVMQTFGGEDLYIPKGTRAEFSRRDREIVALLPHLKMREICARYNITLRRLYQIIHSVYDGVEKPTQLDLFGAGE